MKAWFEFDFELMRERRKQMGMSRAELARRCGLHRNTLYLVESGKRIPRGDALMAIAFQLGLPAEILFEPHYAVSDGERKA